MPSLVHFGAGNIGRGFIAPLFTAGGWTVVFVDIDQARIAALHERRAFTVHEVTNAGDHPVRVAPVDGLLAGDREAVATAIAGADLVSTAVGLGALRHLGPNLAAGLARRGERPLDILVCENGVQAPALLREAIAAHLPENLRHDLERRLGLVRTSIGRMIPPDPGGDLLDLKVEPYAHLPVEADAFRGAAPVGVPGLELRDDFDLVLQQKLYLHNLTHACLGYRGALAGRPTIPACMADADLVTAVRAAGEESAAAMAAEHGATPQRRQTILAECRELLDDLLERYRNRALNDPVPRITRDPFRKLAGDDRLVGAARLCRKHGLPAAHLAHFILDACRYEAAADEPRAEEWNRLRADGWRHVLATTAHLTDQEPLMTSLTVADRQQQAAALIKKAGIFLRPEEVAQIEIADFGLKRYEQIGLAIHVYVNTARCCAKELAMLPGQICPEHRHPMVDGQSGKEETFRCRSGEVFLFLPGDDGKRAKTKALKFLPADKQDSVTAFRCIHLRKGEQCTLPPDTLHWFVAGKRGAVVSEFSTKSRDDADVFTDPAIVRVPTEGPHQG